MVASTISASGRRKAPPPSVRPVAKAASAYRTITEVAAELGVAAHVLRFWESKFSVVQPLKKSGGRRYYKPDDVAVLKHIQSLLYTQGYSVRGVQAYLDKTSKKELRNAAAPYTLSPAQIVREVEAIRAVLTGDAEA